MSSKRRCTERLINSLFELRKLCAACSCMCSPCILPGCVGLCSRETCANVSMASAPFGQACSSGAQSTKEAGAWSQAGKPTGQPWDNYGTTMGQPHRTTMGQPIHNGKSMMFDKSKAKGFVSLEKLTLPWFPIRNGLFRSCPMGLSYGCPIVVPWLFQISQMKTAGLVNKAQSC